MEKEKAWNDLLESWCSGCEVCGFEGDGSCGPDPSDTYARRLFDAGWSAREAQSDYEPPSNTDDTGGAE